INKSEKKDIIVQRHAFYPRRGRRRCTLRHVMPLYNVHPLFTISTRNHNLWITQRVALCRNPTHCTLYGSQLTSHRANQ
ncbi:hypothetical protein SFRURICE_003174, partial [Spodoptera frugiperda]